MNDYYVYLYRDPRNGETIYVGTGRNTRCQEHWSKSGSKGTQPIPKTPFYERMKELRSLSIKPIIERVAIDLTKETGGEIERKLILEIGRRDLGTGPLLNGSDGGEIRKAQNEADYQMKFRTRGREGQTPAASDRKREQSRSWYLRWKERHGRS